MFTINATKKFNKKVEKVQAPKYNCTVKVAGFDSLVIFYEDEKYVTLPDSSKAIITIGKAQNIDFRMTYGEYFILVGKHFMAAAHKEQVAHIYNALRQIRGNVNITKAMEQCRDICKADKYTKDVLTYIGVDESPEVKTDSAARRYIDLAQMVGQKTAKKVIMDSIDVAMSSSKLRAKVIGKTSNYDAKGWKAEVKTCKKENKTSIKTSVKADKEATKVTKAAEKAAKTNEVNLDDLANDVTAETNESKATA